MSRSHSRLKPPDVLVVGYNRPTSLARVLASIPRGSTGNISIWLDGPKARRGDSEAVEACARVAERFLDSTAGELNVLSTNLGCRRSVSGAVSWFLSKAPYGVVLEDDVVPEPGFFEFMRVSLAAGSRTLHGRLGSVSGLSLVPETFLGIEQPFRQSIFFSSWGWGTWAEEWNELNSLRPWKEYATSIEQTLGLPRAAKTHLKRIHRRISTGTMDSWAYITFLEHLRLQRSVLLPTTNLVTNVGFNSEGTHTRSEPLWLSRAPRVLADSQEWALDHLDYLPMAKLDLAADRYMADYVYGYAPTLSFRRLQGITKRVLGSRLVGR